MRPWGELGKEFTEAAEVTARVVEKDLAPPIPGLVGDRPPQENRDTCPEGPRAHFSAVDAAVARVYQWKATVGYQSVTRCGE
ncbi:hypothetical protein NGTWS0302_34460 [Mycolicibacterium cyprinidarum]|uniref:Transposase n=1 Tax=Mycolicibacterium cyprinidarum TaxID=2860311 RepID=A0ABQ4VBU9_9MYCO|nr:hypothetical protein NGTWS0302_34460 [Mycolicibacterium sp. NGTWS0302]GJF17056.1 hypothetical protein NGTWS1803_34100 [Mycolicibacterium sp. NGTWS1803]GJF18430.1 hypothetical protein NGTWS1702_26400 [Mycolicibacterium sp. NGTWSNA01]